MENNALGMVEHFGLLLSSEEVGLALDSLLRATTAFALLFSSEDVGLELKSAFLWRCSSAGSSSDFSSSDKEGLELKSMTSRLGRFSLLFANCCM